MRILKACQKPEISKTERTNVHVYKYCTLFKWNMIHKGVVYCGPKYEQEAMGVLILFPEQRLFQISILRGSLLALATALPPSWGQTHREVDKRDIQVCDLLGQSLQQELRGLPLDLHPQCCCNPETPK